MLPFGYRIASGVSILIYGFIALLALDRAGVADVFPNAFSTAGIWVVFLQLSTPAASQCPAR